MKKLLLKSSIFRGLLSLLFLLAMVGNVWGDTATSSSLSSKSTSAQTIEAGKTITYKCSSSNTYENPARIYKNSTFTISSTDGVTITKIEITTPSGYPANAFSASAGSYNASTTAGTWTGEATSVVFTAGAQVRVSAITVTYTVANTASAPSLTTAGVFLTESMDVTITNNETGATVYYTTDGTAPTTSSTSFTGASTTFSINATTTVKAMAVIEGKSNSSVASATYTKEASIANTAATAYTTAQAKALIDANSAQLATTKVYVTGTISQIDKFNSDSTITYWLDSNAFEVFKGLNADSAKFTSIDDIKVNGTVVVYGKIKKYNTTYEMDQNGWLVSYTAPAVSKSTATLTLGTYQKALTTGDDDEYTVTYDGDGTVSVTSSDEAVADAIIVDGTVAISAKKAGTTTITVSAPETENYYAANKTYTLTVTDPAPAATVPFSFDGGKADLTTGMTQTGIGTDYTSSPKLKFDDANDNLIINYASTARNITYKIKGNSTTSTTVFDVLESADGKTYTTVHSHTGTNITTTATSYTDKLKSDSRYVKFVYTTKSGNVALGAISITNEKADPGLAFGQSTYRFFNYTEGLYVNATSARGSTGAITYSVEEGDENEIILEQTGAVYAESEATFTIKATIAETDDYKEATATCTVIFKSHPTANSIIVAEADGNYFAMTNTYNSGNYIESVQILGKSGDKYVVASQEALNAIEYCTTTSEGKTTIVTMNGQYLQATAVKTVSFTDEEYLWTNDGEKLTAATSTHGVLRYNTTNPRFTTYTSATGKIAQIVSLDDVVFGTTLTISAAGYATYFTDTEFEMPTNLEGYFVTDGAAGQVVLTKQYEAGDIVPAATPLLIKTTEELAEAKTYCCAITHTSAAAAVAENLLHGNLEEGPVEEVTGASKYYKLMKGTHGLGWYLGAEDGGVFSLGANKAYLALTAEQANNAPAIIFDENVATSVEDIEAAGEVLKTIENGQLIIIKDGVRYNVMGVRF